MKTLLLSIDAKYIHTNNAVRLLKANSDFPITILEYTIKDSPDKIIEDILTLNPDVIGCSVYIWNVQQFKTLLQHPYFKQATVVLGGPEVSYDVPTFIAWEHVDFIVSGEGENAFNQLLHRLHTNEKADGIAGITYQENDQIISHPLSEIEDLSTIRMGHFFSEDVPHYPHKITYVESSRGCPYRCSYCLSSLEKSVRFFPLQSVTNVIDYALDMGSKTIKFLDRTFNANRHTMAIIDHIIRVDNGHTIFQFEITGDVLPKSLITYINENARPGLFRFEIGIQSTNDRTNQLVDRHQDTKTLFDRIKQIQTAGVIDLHLDLIAGLPQEDKESFIQTFNQVFRLGAKELQLGFLKLLRGTKIRREAVLYDYVYDKEAPYEMISNNVLSSSDIKEIKQVEHMLEIYHNKGYFKVELLNHILHQPSPYHFFLRLAALYQQHNYPLHGYQLEDVYSHLFDILDEDTIFLIQQDYLMRSTIKPKLFFEHHVNRPIKNKIYSTISAKEHIPLHLLYKHSVLLVHKETYFCAYYHQNTCITFKGKAPH